MLYLLYLRNGFIKKFPLNKERIVMGRAKTSDFCIEEFFVSKEHATITPQANYIDIQDMGSTNGVFTAEGQVKKARIQLNQWFRVGHLRFVLKEGNAEEFVLSDKVRPLFSRIAGPIANIEETHEALNILYTESLVEMLQIGFTLKHQGNLFKDAEGILKSTLKKGSLLLVSKTKDGTVIESQWNYSDQYQPYFAHVVSLKDTYRKAQENEPIENAVHFCSFPVHLKKQTMALIYFVSQKAPEVVVDFLESLSMEIAVIHSLMEQNAPTPSSGNKASAPKIVTVNPDMINLLSRCRKIAQSNLSVLIEGDTGTGKELFGQFLHFHSKRSQGSFIGLNCAAIPENLMEVELFGHEKGAFTDASSQRKGKLEMASGGTLVLDEIGDMPLNLQAKLLRTIQEEQFYRVGGNIPIKVDLRIICLTNKNIKDLMQRKLFREDLYYRIAHVTLRIPPLRNRKEDIVPLINHFMEYAAGETGIYIKGFSDRAIQAMETYDWPGNIREFENEMLKVINLSENGDIVDLESLKEEISEFYESHTPATQSQELEKKRLLMLLERYKWNKTQVAKELNVSRMTLYEKLKKYGI